MYVRTYVYMYVLAEVLRRGKSLDWTDLFSKLLYITYMHVSETAQYRNFINRLLDCNTS
jgi:hypothetical protein